MKGVAEFSACLGLAAGVHLAIWHAGTDPGAGSAGAAGDSLVTLTSAGPAIAALVAEWDRPPETAPAPTAWIQPPATERAPAAPHLSAAPETSASLPLPQTATPDVAPAPDLSVPPPPARKAPANAVRPQPRPDAEPPTPAATAAPAKPASTPAPSQPAPEIAGGSGTSGAGAKREDSAGKPNATGTPDLIARWGGKIIGSIERRKRYPAGSRAAGKVTVALSIAPSGALVNVGIARSSGDAALDNAAIAAVRSARLPGAPAGLSGGPFDFTLSVAFTP